MREVDQEEKKRKQLAISEDLFISKQNADESTAQQDQALRQRFSPLFLDDKLTVNNFQSPISSSSLNTTISSDCKSNKSSESINNNHLNNNNNYNNNNYNNKLIENENLDYSECESTIKSDMNTQISSETACAKLNQSIPLLTNNKFFCIQFPLSVKENLEKFANYENDNDYINHFKNQNQNNSNINSSCRIYRHMSDKVKTQTRTGNLNRFTSFRLNDRLDKNHNINMNNKLLSNQSNIHEIVSSNSSSGSLLITSFDLAEQKNKQQQQQQQQLKQLSNVSLLNEDNIKENALNAQLESQIDKNNNFDNQINKNKLALNKTQLSSISMTTMDYSIPNQIIRSDNKTNEDVATVEEAVKVYEQVLPQLNDEKLNRREKTPTKLDQAIVTTPSNANNLNKNITNNNKPRSKTANVVISIRRSMRRSKNKKSSSKLDTTNGTSTMIAPINDNNNMLDSSKKQPEDYLPKIELQSSMISNDLEACGITDVEQSFLDENTYINLESVPVIDIELNIVNRVNNNNNNNHNNNNENYYISNNRNNLSSTSSSGMIDESENEKNKKEINATHLLQVTKRERCDSGVGGSLTREIGKKRNREKWSSFVKSHRPSFKSTELQVNSLSVKQYAKLKKFALVRITALLEKHSQVGPKSTWNKFKYLNLNNNYSHSCFECLNK